APSRFAMRLWWKSVGFASLVVLFSLALGVNRRSGAQDVAAPALEAPADEAVESPAPTAESDGDAKEDEDPDPPADPPTTESPTAPSPTADPPSAETPATDAEAAKGQPAEAKPAGETPAAPPVAPRAAIDEANPGQADLDKALEIKITAEELKDLNEVVDLLDDAIEKGLDAENSDFAEQVLVATLVQRAQSLSGAILDRPVPDPRADPRWLQIRQLALNDLLRAVGIDESQREAWLLIGRLQSLNPGSKSEARRALTRVIRSAEAAAKDPALDQMNPTELARAYALRGAAQKGDPERTADFGRAIELDPKQVEYLQLRAQAHQAAQRPAECLADLDRAIVIEPENTGLHQMKALALLMQEKPEEAIESFNRATELDPDSVAPYQYRGEVYSKLGKPEEAIKQLDKALELSPNNLASLLIRAELLMTIDKWAPALKDVEAALGQQPGLVRAHLMRARALDELGRTSEAVAALERVAAAAPDRADVQLQIAAFYVENEQAPEAIAALTRVLNADPESELANRLRGDMRLLVGDHAGALEDFAKACERAPDDAGVLNNYAWTLATSPFAALRNGKRAVELATKACESTEFDEPHILSTLAAAYAEAGDFAQAVKWSEDAVAKAKELGKEANYDGQLDAELASYRNKQPWRELKRDGDVVADSPAAGEQPPTAPPAAEDSAKAPVRSFDF
ncbi:MAG: tetratricopeptide repeat protein, partial [Lacipirellulaceae bacterium]